MNFADIKQIDTEIKRRILAHKDQICIYTSIDLSYPTLCFEFHSYSLVLNGLPEEINREYHVGKELGRGSYGAVNFVQNRQTCESFALKYTIDKDKRTIEAMSQEVDILKTLQHSCILRLYDAKIYENLIAIFTDFMKGGDLCERLQDCGYFQENQTKFIFLNICMTKA